MKFLLAFLFVVSTAILVDSAGDQNTDAELIQAELIQREQQLAGMPANARRRAAEEQHEKQLAQLGLTEQKLAELIQHEKQLARLPLHEQQRAAEEHAQREANAPSPFTLTRAAREHKKPPPFTLTRGGRGQ